MRLLLLCGVLLLAGGCWTPPDDAEPFDPTARRTPTAEETDRAIRALQDYMEAQKK